MSRYVLNDEQEALYRAAPRLVTPSKPEPWEGAYPAGARYTGRQLAEMRNRGLDPKTIDFLLVEAPGDPRRIYIPLITYFYRRIPCPIVGRRGDRLSVIAPDGSTKLVYPNGQLSRKRAA